MIQALIRKNTLGEFVVFVPERRVYGRYPSAAMALRRVAQVAISSRPKKKPADPQPPRTE